MKKRFGVPALLLFVAAMTLSSAAQSTKPIFTAEELAKRVPAAKAGDVDSIASIVQATYACISGPAGTRDWNRFRSLFLPEARFTASAKHTDGTLIVFSAGVEDYIREATPQFAKAGFFENAIVSTPQRYGHMAQVFSSYESRHAPGEKPFERGINSFQLINDGTRWWVVSIAWAGETADNPLPAGFAVKP